MSYEKLEVTKGLMEAYIGMYDASQQEENISEEVEQIDEAQIVPAAAKVNQQTTKPRPGESAADARTRAGAVEYTRRGGLVGQLGRTLTRGFGSNKDIAKVDATDKASQARINQRVAATQGKYYSSSDQKTYANYNDAVAARNSRLNVKPDSKPEPGSGNPPAGTKTAPVASGTVLAKKDGVTGTLDKATGKFTEKGWSDKETLRYQSASTPKPGTKAAGPESIKPKTPNRLMKDMPSGVNSPENEARRGAAALASMASSPNKDRLLGSKIGQQSYDRVLNAPTPKPAPSPAASTSALGSAAKPEVRSALGLKPLNTAQATTATTKPVAPEVKATNTASATPAPVTPNPSATTKTTPEVNDGKKRDKPLWEERDLFDVILEHLLEEGYADTNKAALVIMANMSEEWKQSIIEAVGIVGPPSKAIDKIPGVRAVRSWASDTVKAMDYGENEPVSRTASGRVIPRGMDPNKAVDASPKGNGPVTVKTKPTKNPRDLGNFVPGDDRMSGQPQRSTRTDR